MSRLPFALVLGVALSGAALSQPAKGGLRAMGYTAAEFEAMAPGSPNPFTAYLAAGVVPDYEYWTVKLALDGSRRAEMRSARGLRAAPSARYRERERAVFNRNDGLAEAERLAADVFGAAADEPVVVIEGTLEPPPARPLQRKVSTVEDRPTGGVVAWPVDLRPSTGVAIAAKIGDGPFGASTGDVDVYDVTVAQAGTYAQFSVQTPVGDLDPVMALFAPDGSWVFTADDAEDSYDPTEALELQAARTYRLYVWGYTAGGAGALDDLDDAGSGHGVGSTGPYELQVSSFAPDVDSYAVSLEAGDVLGAATSAPAEDVTLYAPDGGVLMRSRADISGGYPVGGPLLSPAELGGGPGGLTAAAVAPVAGTYVVSVRGEGAYTLVLQGARPGHERSGGRAVDSLFVDFDGGTYSPAEDLGDPRMRASVELSPLSAFLSRWGLDAGDESAVVDAVLATLERTLRDDLRGVPGMGRLDLVVLNSRDHADPGRGVNRLVIGGTLEEMGADGFLGQASTVDVGNFRHDDVAYVALDLLSESPDDPSSINQFDVGASRTRAELVGLGVGVVAAHEAGHFFGLHHTDNENDVHNVQDAGGRDLASAFDVGDDRTFGAGDGAGVGFRADNLFRTHGFEGVQHSPAALAHSLHGPAGPRGRPASSADAVLSGAGFSAAARAAATARTRGLRPHVGERFADDGLGWGWQSTSSASSAHVHDGALVVTADAGQSVRVPFRTPGRAVADDFAARFAVRHEAGCAAAGAGVFLRRTDRVFVQARLGGDPSGTALDGFDRGSWVPLAGWEPAGISLREGSAVEAVVLGRQVSIVVDGRLVRQFALPQGVEGGVAGFLVAACDGAPATYRFDDLVVVSLDPIADLSESGAPDLTPRGDALASAVTEGTAPPPVSAPATPRAAPGGAPAPVGVRSVSGGHPTAQGYVFTFGQTRVRLTEGEGSPRLWVLTPGAEVWRAAWPGEVDALLVGAGRQRPAVAAESPLAGTEAEAAVDRLRHVAGATN